MKSQDSNLKLKDHKKSNIWLLFTDEFRGFYKSKIMMILWIGLPLISFLLQYLNPDSDDLDGMPLISLIVILISSIGGSLSAVMISTSIANERGKNVYDLFLVRPVKRFELITSKYLAVLSCVFIAIIISLFIGAVVDYINQPELPQEILKEMMKTNIESIIISFCSVIISCSLGVLFGVIIKSTAAVALFSLYIGNQLSSIILLPTVFYKDIPKIPYVLSMAAILGLGLFLISLIIFNKKDI